MPDHPTLAPFYRRLAALPAEELVRGDQKSFTFDVDGGWTGTLGFAVIETTDDAVLLEPGRRADLTAALSADRDARGVDLSLLAVVNIVSLRSTLLLCGDGERSLALAAFGPPPTDAATDLPVTGACSVDGSGDCLALGGLVSRKNDFVPRVTRAIKAGWAPPTGAGSAGTGDKAGSGSPTTGSTGTADEATA